jgi:hypothetical protein
VFSCVFTSVSSVFRRILQIFYLDVSKLDRVLLGTHLPQLPAAAARAPLGGRRCPGGESRGGASSPRVESGGVDNIRKARPCVGA